MDPDRDCGCRRGGAGCGIHDVRSLAAPEASARSGEPDRGPRRGLDARIGGAGQLRCVAELPSFGSAVTIPVRPAATSRPGALILTDSNLFGPGQMARTKLFARRVLTVAE